MAKPFSWRAWKLFHRSPGSAHCALAASSCTYTQILKDKNGEPLEVARHGLNRDAVRVALIGSQVGVIALADGCGLVYWSEIAAQIIVNEFITYIEKHLPKDGPYTPTAMKTLLKTAIQNVNQNMLVWKHPKTKSKCNVLDKGGNSTLVVAIVFPYVEDESTSPQPSRANETVSPPHPPLSSASSPSSSSGDLRSSTSSKGPDSSHETHAKPSRKHSTASEPEQRFGVVFTGMGDSELYLFKCNEPEKPAKDKKHHAQQSSISMPSISDDHRRTTSPPSSPRDHSDHPEDTSFTSTQPGAQKYNKHAAGNKEKKPTNSKSSVNNYHSLPGHHSKKVEGASPSPRETSASVSIPISPKADTRPLRSSSGTAVPSPSHSPSHSTMAASSSSPSAAAAPTSMRTSPLTSPREARTTRSVSFSSPRQGVNHGSNPITSSAPTGSPSGDGKFTFTTRIAPSSSAEDTRSTSHQSGSSQPSSSQIAPLRVSTTSPSTPVGSTPLSPSTPTEIPLSKLAPAFSAALASGLSSGPSTPSDPHALASAHLLHPISHETSASSLASSPPQHTDLTSLAEAENESTPLDRSTDSAFSAAPLPDAPPPSAASTMVSSGSSELVVPMVRGRQASDPPSPSTLTSGSASNGGASMRSATVSNATGGSNRAKRYSKSFSDIPSFDELESSPLSSAGSLRLNFDAVHSDVASTSTSGATSEQTLTPRLPCGTWHKIMSDSGKSPFLPFPGLREKSIPEPNFIALSPGDSVVACSDGVVQSYENHEVQWPDIMAEQYETKEGLERTCQALLQSTMTHHKLSQMDPDDVTIGAIKVTSYAKRKRSDALRVAPVRDLTSQFAPEFSASTYKRDYLGEFLSEYPKPKDKPM